MPNTRKNIECEVFGAPTELKYNILSTYGDVMGAYLWYRQIVKDDNNGKDPSVSEVSKKVISALKNIWENASLQMVEENLSLSESSSTSEIRGVNFRNLAEACDRTGVFDRCASFLANAVLQDLGSALSVGTTLQNF
ncbi:unnamed protein product [Brassicogethes aeneus]|uniref:Uncharacterized protein n=1 Tax=Brassicogethes aeneus TaxID=1431903 RepID=A0A9P0FNQ1_BRAAE|nr:unnamed protein product [Brassicogethes aeneus]